jgi:hypothetical protein
MPKLGRLQEGTYLKAKCAVNTENFQPSLKSGPLKKQRENSQQPIFKGRPLEKWA